MAEVIETVQLNPPEESTVAPQLVIEAPALTELVIVTPGVYPVPERLTSTPLGPWKGLSAIVGTVNVNVTEAVSNEPSEPVAVTEYSAWVVDVRVTGQENVPLDVTAALHEVTEAPAPIETWIVTSGVKPLPESDTPTPLGPCTGSGVTEGKVIRNDAVALSNAPSDPVTVSV